MLRTSLLIAFTASASCFAPASLPTIDNVAIPPLGRPKTPMFDGTWAGDAGFDPLAISGWLDPRWLREAELKNGRVAMLATAGAIAQDLFTFPGTVETFGTDKLTKLHDAVVKKGTFGQLLFWLSLFEIFSTASILQWYTQGSTRKPGFYGFDPLNLGQGKDAARMELAEIKNGRLAMIAIGGIIHHFFITGKGPIELLTKP